MVTRSTSVAMAEPRLRPMMRSPYPMTGDSAYGDIGGPLTEQLHFQILFGTSVPRRCRFRRDLPVRSFPALCLSRPANRAR